MQEGERGQGRGPKVPKTAKSEGTKTVKAFEEHFENLEQIEYLLFQSTQGIHFMFANQDIAKVLSQPLADQDFLTDDNMKKVQTLLSDFLDCKTLQAKQCYLDRLALPDFELLVRAYFHLVENTILAQTNTHH